MKRRDVLKALGVSAAIGASAPAVAAINKRSSLPLRSVFKIVPSADPPLHQIKIGSDEWAPTPDDLDKLRRTFEQATMDRDAIITPYYVDIEHKPAFIMVKCGFEDLRKGDWFVLYEKTGEVVLSKHRPEDGAPCVEVETEYSISVCLEDPKQTNGVWGVRCDPVIDAMYFVPAECPA